MTNMARRNKLIASLAVLNFFEALNLILRRKRYVKPIKVGVFGSFDAIYHRPKCKFLNMSHNVNGISI